MANEFTVVTYDRRGNSRSGRPPGWTTTSVREQADDAAGIIQANNADTILDIESPGFAGWQPSTEDLAALRVPVALVIARDTLPVYRQVTDWLAVQLEAEPITVPGRHAFYYYRPQDLADVLRPILRRFAG
jgi:hypothetical protein